MPASLQILIVEEHAPNKEPLSQMLIKRGYSILSASSAEKARAMAATENVDLLIFDIGLSDGNGWLLLTELRTIHPRIKAIALTGFGYGADISRSEEAGFPVHLTEPSDLSAIESKIRELFPSAGVGKA